MWALVLLLAFGTPQEREVVIAIVPSWHICFQRASAEMRKHPNDGSVALRCERAV